MDARTAVVAGMLSVVVAASTATAKERAIAPANDDFASATVATEVPFADTVDTRIASLEVGEPQASCAPAGKTIWYQFTPSEDITMLAEATSQFRAGLGIFQGTSLLELTEIACSTTSLHPVADFQARAGETYYFQIGTRTKGGPVDFHLTPARWQQKTLHAIDVPVEIPDIDVPLLVVDGRPRASDPAMYDLSVQAANQAPVKRGLLTLGLVRESLHLELVDIKGTKVDVSVRVSYRYDPSAYRCVTDDGEGGTCTLKFPINDTKWVTERDGSKAELVVHVAASQDGKIVAERATAIPFAGQIVGMP